MQEQRTAKDREQHLYLLFDDWHSGYSIRKVSLSRRSGKRAEQPSSSGSGGEGVEPLPVFMRIQAQRGFPFYFTSAFGPRIIVMHPGSGDPGGIPMIDVQEQTILFGPDPNYNYNAYPIYFPVGDNKLFTLDIGTFDCYLLMPENSEEPWQCQDLSDPPFKRADVSYYGVRPDGCILISIKSGATFIFDTKEYVWKPCGNWVLPFTGRGHYDTSLKGFVGLSKDPETLGYLYCSTMASTGTSPDGFKRTKEKVFNNHPAEGYVSATLVHMRPGKFCLVECVSWTHLPPVDEFKVPLGANRWDFIGGGPQCGRFMYCLKTFSLFHDSKGDLKLKHCKVRCCSLPHEARFGTICADPVAFWL